MKTTRYIHRKGDGIVVQVPYLTKGRRRLKTKILYTMDFRNDKEMFNEAVWWRNYFVDRYGREYQERVRRPKPMPPTEGACMLIESLNIRATKRLQTSSQEYRILLTTLLKKRNGALHSIVFTVNETNFREKLEAMMLVVLHSKGEYPEINKRLLNRGLRNFRKWIKENQHEGLLANVPSHTRRQGMISWMTRDEKIAVYKEMKMSRLGLSEKAFALLSDEHVEHCRKAISL